MRLRKQSSLPLWWGGGLRFVRYLPRGGCVEQMVLCEGKEYGVIGGTKEWRN
jgi:hypothetical protein